MGVFTDNQWYGTGTWMDEYLKRTEQCFDSMITSPLIEYAEGDFLPNVVSVDSVQSCNDATSADARRFVFRCLPNVGRTA